MNTTNRTFGEFPLISVKKISVKTANLKKLFLEPVISRIQADIDFRRYRKQ